MKKRIKDRWMLQIFLKLFVVSFWILFPLHSKAMMVDWSGVYRIEYAEIDRPSLDSDKMRKSYLLNSLQLGTDIIASDGINIFTRFDVLNNANYPDDQTGVSWGSGPKKAGGSSSSSQDSGVNSSRQGSSSIQVNQLYLKIKQDNGLIVVGRVPVFFGLGIAYNGGKSPFEDWYKFAENSGYKFGKSAFNHWSNTMDVVGYKFAIGNGYIIPIVGRPYDTSIAQGQNVTDLIWDIGYNNPETDSQFGVYHLTRTASLEANDAPFGQYGRSTGGSVPDGNAINGDWSTKHVNIFFGRGFDDFKFRVEAGFQSEKTGVKTASGGEVKLNGYGIVSEMDFLNPSGKWETFLKFGIVSGDNPDTTNYEGYHLNRNYDVAFMLFNHPMGQYDVFRTSLQRSPVRPCTTAPCGTYTNDVALDEEAISNVIFFAPKFVKRLNDNWDWTHTVTWAQLQTDPRPDLGVSKDVGFEYDMGFNHKLSNKIQWVNEIGVLFPGNAWRGGSMNYGNSMNFGILSKAAISF